MGKDEIVILGAGPSGLPAALMLARAGKKVYLIEKQGMVGGLASTVSRDGLSFDVGPHALPTQNQKLIDLINELCGEDIIVVPRNTSIYLKKKFFIQPIEIKNVLKNISFISLLGICFDLIWLTISKPFRNSNLENSFEVFVKSRVGRTLYNLFFGPYTWKVWGRKPGEISYRLASQRLPKIELKQLLKIIVGKKSDDWDLHFQSFYYHKMGIGKIYERMADSLRENGGELLLNCSIKQIQRNGKRVTGIDVESNGAIRHFDPSYVLSTIPLNEFLKLLTPGVEPSVQKSVDKLGYRSLVFLFLHLKTDWSRNDQWIYFLDRIVKFNRVSSQRQMSEHMVPDDGTILCLEFSCDEGDEVWNQDREYFYFHAVSELMKSELFDENDILDYFIMKRSHIYPVYHKGYEKDLTKLVDELKTIENVLSYGRQGFYNNDTNMTRCYEFACKAAEYVLAEKNGTWEWYNEMLEYFGYETSSAVRKEAGSK